jgi:hypothetical protein
VQQNDGTAGLSALVFTKYRFEAASLGLELHYLTLDLACAAESDSLTMAGNRITQGGSGQYQ